MKKFLLVVFIGMVLAINLYGIVDKYMDSITVEEVDPLDGVATVVYEE